jgi:hypothetical protein
VPRKACRLWALGFGLWAPQLLSPDSPRGLTAPDPHKIKLNLNVRITTWQSEHSDMERNIRLITSAHLPEQETRAWLCLSRDPPPTLCLSFIRGDLGIFSGSTLHSTPTNFKLLWLDINLATLTGPALRLQSDCLHQARDALPDVQRQVLPLKPHHATVFLALLGRLLMPLQSGL